jgi:putative peptidoglycan lipid II flippase
MLLNVGLNFLFFRPLGNGGPGLATSLAATFNAIALLVMFRRRNGPLGVRAVGISCVKFATAALIMGMITAALIHMRGFYAGPMPQRSVALGLTIAFAAATFFAAAYVLRTSELGEVRRILRPNEGLDETSRNRQTAGM